MMTNLLNGAHVANNLLNVLQGYSKTIRLLLVMFLTLTVSAEVWAESITITPNDITDYPTTAAYGERTWSVDGITGKAKVYGSKTSHAALQFNSANRTIWNTTPLPGHITSVVITTASGTARAWVVRGGTSSALSNSTNSSYGNAIGNSQTVTTEGTTFTVSNDEEYNYFLCYLNASNASYIKSIVINYEISGGGTGGDGDSGDDSGDNNGECTWELVTDASTLKAGDRVVIAAKDYNYAISTDQKDNNRGQAAITKSENNITWTGSSVQVLAIEAGTTSGTFAFNTGDGYLYAASSSKNYMRTETTLSDNSSWEITIADDGTATIVAQGTNTHNTMQYNQSSSIFSCYGSASQKAIVIYKEVCTGGTTETSRCVTPKMRG